MVMEEMFAKLRSLQDVLSGKISLEDELHDIPKDLAVQEELLRRFQKSHSERQTACDQNSQLIQELKTKLFEAESSREKYEKQMDSISTQREYEALDKEIRDASDREQQYRVDLQREEKNSVELLQALERDAEAIRETEEEVNQKRVFIEEKSSEKRSELASLNEEEARIIPGIDSEIVFKFERIIRSKQGLGIVSVKNGVCSGCHMILPAQFVNEVHEGNKIIFCPYCSRILFYEEAEDGEDAFLSDIESGGLADLDDFEDEDEEDDDDFDESENEKGGGGGGGFDDDQ